ncbi:MAG TPA: amidohydrolase, partial [Sphingomicrobium sp.]
MFDKPHSRRRFMALGAGGMAGALTGPWLRAAAAAEPQDADLVVFNAKVYTVDKSAPTAQAFAVRNGRFI